MYETDVTTDCDGGRIEAREIARALTRAPFTYASATQVFTPDGRTTYVEDGLATYGEWGVDEQGQFWSSWPPDYRAEYDLFWITDANGVIGVRFVELGHGAKFDGRYSLQTHSPTEG